MGTPLVVSQSLKSKSLKLVTCRFDKILVSERMLRDFISELTGDKKFILCGLTSKH